MAFDFPSPATVGQQFTPAGGPTYTFSGTGWTTAGQPSSAILAMQVFVNTGTPTNPFTTTYTPTPGMQTAIVECVGGGGGGNGVAGTSSNYYSGGGGGAGGYSRKFVTAAQIGTSQTVTIGAGGTGSAVGFNTGGAGGDTSLGSLCVAKGARIATTWALGGLGGAVGTGDITATGTPGSGGSNNTTTAGTSLVGNGASSIFGGGGFSISTLAGANGANASNYGAGGGGAANWATAANYAGGNGSPGIVIITEYGNVSVGTGSAAYTDAGYQNKFRNGMMDVAQRGTSLTGVTSGYTLDGWIISAAVGIAWSQQYNANLSANALRLNCATGLTGLTCYQRMESSIAAQLLNRNKSAQPITIQFTIYNGLSGGATLTPQLRTTFPTARDNWGASTVDLATTSLQPIPNGTIATVSYTFVPSTSCQLGYAVILDFGGALNAASGSVDISYADIRATPGLITGLNNSPPPVEMRPIQQELAFCQRYFWQLTPAAVATTLVGYVNNTTVCTYSVLFPVPMRIAPGGTASAASDWQNRSAGSANAGTSVSFFNLINYGVFTLTTGTSTNTPGFAALLQTVNTTANIQFSAEL